MEPVVAQFVLDPEHDHDAAGDADGQTGCVDKGITLVSEEITECDL